MVDSKLGTPTHGVAVVPIDLGCLWCWCAERSFGRSWFWNTEAQVRSIEIDHLLWAKILHNIGWEFCRLAIAILLRKKPRKSTCHVWIFQAQPLGIAALPAHVGAHRSKRSTRSSAQAVPRRTYLDLHGDNVSLVPNHWFQYNVVSETCSLVKLAQAQTCPSSRN